MKVFEISVFKLYLEDFQKVEFPGQIIKTDFRGKYILLENQEFLDFLIKNFENPNVKFWIEKRNLDSKIKKFGEKKSGS